ncbi:TPA: hypothetical protein ACPZSC_003872 [Yersinia enterocolitica]
MGNKNNNHEGIITSNVDVTMKDLFYNLGNLSQDDNFVTKIENSAFGPVFKSIKDNNAEEDKYPEVRHIINWLSQKAKSDSITEDELSAILICIYYFSPNKEILQEILSTHTNAPNNLKSSCYKEISKYSLPDDFLLNNIPHNDKRTSCLTKLLASKDIKKLQMDISIYNDLLPIFIPLKIKSCLMALSILHPELVDECITSFDNPLKAYFIISGLDRLEMLRLSITTNSHRTRNLSLCYYFSSLNRTTSLSSIEESLLTESFVNLYKKNEFDTWMTILNEYPCRYEHIQIPLGNALANIHCKDALESYFEAIKLYPFDVNSNNTNSRELVMKCLMSFTSSASSAMSKEAWLIAFKKWGEWNFGANETHYLFYIAKSELDYPVIKYFIECMSSKQREEYKNDILKMTMAIDNIWHSSHSALTTYYYRCMSKLQVYHHATDVIDKKYSSICLNHFYTLKLSEYESMRIR